MAKKLNGRQLHVSRAVDFPVIARPAATASSEGEDLHHCECLREWQIDPRLTSFRPSIVGGRHRPGLGILLKQ